MIELIEGVRPGESKLLDEAFRHRHQIFVEEKGWNDLRREDGREIDQFDTPATVHFIARVDNKVAGYVRINPTTGPHLLGDVHYHLCAKDYRKGPDVWEWSRYSVAPTYREKRGDLDVSSALLLASLEWADDWNISSIVLEFHPLWITRFLQHRFEVKPLGLPVMFEGESTVAVQLGFNKSTIDGMRAARGFRQPVLPLRYRRQKSVA
ncbi:MAG: GNAT family N-acetyltransferase [Xanthobacteraceae bacterium]|nr:MAG: GNAT family N-acetyltransferase [Xanthobacteraceae bacterium]